DESPPGDDLVVIGARVGRFRWCGARGVAAHLLLPFRFGGMALPRVCGARMASRHPTAQIRTAISCVEDEFEVASSLEMECGRFRVPSAWPFETGSRSTRVRRAGAGGRRRT